MALQSIYSVAGAIFGLNGSKANIGIAGTNGFLNSSLGANSVSSNSITPNSSLSTINGANTDNSRQLNIGEGAIVIQSTGNEGYDADKLLKELEDKILEARDKSLGG